MILNEKEIYSKCLKVIAANNDMNLSPTEVKVLVALLSDNSTGIELFLPNKRAEIVKELGIHNTTYSTTLNKLAQKGLINETENRGIYEINPYLLNIRASAKVKGVVRLEFKYEKGNSQSLLENSQEENGRSSETSYTD